MTTPSILLTPRRQAVPAGFATTLEVLVRIAAPEAPATTAARAPLHLAIVIDRSGSMSGQPLDEAKKAAAFIIENLSANDRVSLVVYDDKVDVLAPLGDMSQRASLLATLHAIQAGGWTNLHGGWLAGAEALAHAARPSVLSRVILLSDGCANRGLDDPAAIAKQCAEMASAGVTTSTYGLGQNFNETLMIDMARSGQGNSYYGQTAADLMDPFREEFALLNALCARQLALYVYANPEVRIELLNNYPSLPKQHVDNCELLPQDYANSQQPWPDQGWRLPDLAYGAEAWALLRLTVPAALESASPLTLFRATVYCQDVHGASHVPLAASLQLPVVSPAMFGALAEDDLVKRRLGELDAAKLQEHARNAARHGNWDKVDALLSQAVALGLDNPWVAGVVQELQQLAKRRDEMMFAKEAAYSSARMHSRTTALNEPAGQLLDAPTFLRRKTVQGKGTPEGTPRP